MKIIHIITGLNTGGAEMMLYKLLQYSIDKGIQWEVISLTDIGPVGAKIQQLGIPVRALHMNGWNMPLATFRLAFWLRRSGPDIVQTWMYHADLVGGIAIMLSFLRIPVIWGIRQSDLHPQLSKKRTIWVARLSSFLSDWIPSRIIINSEKGKNVHRAFGYSSKNMVVVPNGFDTDRFYPNPDARSSIRKELGISPGTPLIGCIARFDPQKDHRTFVEAARILQASLPSVHFLLCGRGVTWENRELTAWIGSDSLKDLFHLLGERDDTPCIIAALDIATLSAAYGEGFPNVLGEAMACGIPCVATDVGDSKNIIKDTGITVAVGDATGIAEGWERMLRMGEYERGELGRRARERVVQHFSISRVVEQYHSLYKEIYVA